MMDPTAPGPLASTAALMADPARARMLAALMGGEAMTAGELARIAGVVPATASGHLARLAEGGLILVHAQGRHRYHRLASEEVAAAIETLGGLSARIATALAGRFDVILFGHSHAMEDTRYGQTRLINPGALEPGGSLALVDCDETTGIRDVNFVRV